MEEEPDRKPEKRSKKKRVDKLQARSHGNMHSRMLSCAYQNNDGLQGVESILSLVPATAGAVSGAFGLVVGYSRATSAVIVRGSDTHVVPVPASVVSEWVHLAVTHSASALEVYVNGEPVHAAPRSPGTGVLSERVELVVGNAHGHGGAAASQAGSRGFCGRIAEVRVWSRTLTAAQIQGNMFRSFHVPDEFAHQSPLPLDFENERPGQPQALHSTGGVGVRGPEAAPVVGGGVRADENELAHVMQQLPHGQFSFGTQEYQHGRLAFGTSGRAPMSDDSFGRSGGSNAGGAFVVAAVHAAASPPAWQFGAGGGGGPVTRDDVVADAVVVQNDDVAAAAGADAGDAAGASATSGFADGVDPDAIGLAGCWRFDEGAGVVVLDHSKFRCHVVVENIEWARDVARPIVPAPADEGRVHKLQLPRCTMPRTVAICNGDMLCFSYPLPQRALVVSVVVSLETGMLVDERIFEASEVASGSAAVVCDSTAWCIAMEGTKRALLRRVPICPTKKLPSWHAVCVRGVGLCSVVLVCSCESVCGSQGCGGACRGSFADCAPHCAV